MVGWLHDGTVGDGTVDVGGAEEGGIAEEDGVKELKVVGTGPEGGITLEDDEVCGDALLKSEVDELKLDGGSSKVSSRESQMLASVLKNWPVAT
jgi:hypothetical protein